MSDSAEATTSPLVEDVLAPISDEDPVGADVSYDDDFLALKDQVDQISSVSPEGVDYDEIADNARSILKEKSKDFRVATYLALALARTGGYGGIAEALRVQQAMVDTYWEPAYPPVRRMRARQNSFQFVAERLVEALEGLKPTAADRQSIENAQETLNAVQEFTMEAMGEQAPMWSGLSRALANALLKVPKEEPEAPAAPSGDGAAADTGTTDGARTAASSAATPTAPPQAGEIDDPDDALQRVLILADFMRQAKPSDPAPYRLLRCALWDDLVSEPMNESGATPFDAPLPHRFTYFNTLLESKEWDTLLASAESAFREVPLHFWLDLQRFTAAALDALGEQYQRAKQAVLFETAMLLERVPSLPQLTFADGVPFADPKTRFWLDDVVLPIFAGDGGGAALADEAAEKEYDEAKRLAGGGKLNEAVSVLQDGLQHAGAGRGRFLRRFYIAQICMQADKPGVACSILEKLSTEIDAHGLHEWEPSMALDVWCQLHRCYGLLSGDDETDGADMEENARRVFARICEIDASRALES